LEERFRSVIDWLVKKGAGYADLRREVLRSESIQVRDGALEGFSTDLSSGVGIRVLWGGAWGFAATNLSAEKDLLKAAGEALAMAKAFASFNAAPVRLSPASPAVDAFSTPFRVDPFSVTAEEKIGLLMEVTSEALKKRDIAVSEAFMDFSRVEKEFYSSEGSKITQTLLTSGGGYHVIAENGREVQRRSFPDAHHGLFSTAGYELFDDLDMKTSVERVAEEARALLKAKECPAEKTDIIIDGAQMALQLHESCGHPVELDRALGTETGLAGGSFLSLDKKGSFRYGSKHVNIYADPTHPGGAGSYRYDDEGVRARRVDLVKEGVFTGYLTSRESATALNEASNGSMRADGWGALPLIRMSNICIEPGKPSLAELIADTKKGIFLSTNRSWSIDDLRLNFQFGTEIAYEIRNGRLGQPYKNPVYYGMTPAFWGSCDAVCREDEWRMWGLNSCAKGEPLQTAGVGHGASPARFRGVSVGVSRDE
jgi:TldD protein